VEKVPLKLWSTSSKGTKVNNHPVGEFFFAQSGHPDCVRPTQLSPVLKKIELRRSLRRSTKFERGTKFERSTKERLVIKTFFTSYTKRANFFFVKFDQLSGSV
jgi:hypothetical protein